MVHYDNHITLIEIIEEEVQGGPARGRGRGGRGTRGRGCGRCANRGRELDGLEDAAVGGEHGGQLIEEDMDVGVGMGMGVSGRVSNADRQRLVDAFEDDDDYTNSLPFWAFVSNGSKHHTCLIGGDDMQAFIRDEQEKLYNSLSPPSPRLVRN